MTNLRNILVKTADGDFNIIVDSEDTAIASGFGDLSELISRLPQGLQKSIIKSTSDHPYKIYIEKYYSGDKTALSKIKISKIGNKLQIKTWEAIVKIPYGKTISYKDLAIQVGSPGAFRAIGTACGANRLALIIPCHRVIKSNGDIGKYLYGSSVKESLLISESAI